MRYGQGLLDEILRRTDLVQLVGRRVKLTRKGRVLWGCCPFHKEKSPSFKVENERRTYKCFGCGAGGDAFKWTMETEGLSFPESVEKLAQEAGVELPKWSAEDEERELKKKSLYEIVEAACVFFEDQLRAKGSEAAREYLLTRGLNGEAAKKFRLGYAPGGDALKEHLYAKNIPLDDMVAAGLVRPQDGDKPARDFFYNRVIFPISDARGRMVAFGARALDPDAKPKYINTGETSLFSKGQQLYNFATARAAALKAQTIILAEGYMDVIALVRAGFEHAVAPLGTAFTEDQLQLLWRTAPEPILCFDGDSAGLRAGLRAAHLALPHLKPGFSLRFAFLPEGEDPDTLIKRDGPIAMKKILDEAQPLSKVLWRAETEDKDFSTPERRAGLERTLAELVSRISDAKIAEYYRRDFEQQVFDAFKKPKTTNYRRADGSRERPSRQFSRRDDIGIPRISGTVSSVVKNSPLAVKKTANVQQLARDSNKGRVSVTKPEPILKPAERGADATLASDRRTVDIASRSTKEKEICRILLQHPHLGVSHAEMVADLPFSDRSLDRFRHELLNLAASGSRLENQGFENHLVRNGMADLVERLNARALASGETASAENASQGHGDDEDIEARWLRAVSQLRDMADPERDRAVERFKSEGTEESWQDARRLLEIRAQRED